MNELTILILIIFSGMAVGSFLTMASYRLSVTNKSIKKLLLEPSSCPKCQKNLKVLNLIPIFSWILQKGCCAFCKSKIPMRYPLIEIVNTFFFVIIYFYLGQEVDLKLVIYLSIFSCLFLMIITDLEHYFISDLNQIILFILAIFYHFNFTFTNINSEPISYYIVSAIIYLLAALTLSFGYKIFRRKDGIGIDDIKFFAIAGFFIGINDLALFMMLSGLIGILFGFIWQKIKDDNCFPFAPALITSLVICLLQ
jgi:prepilin signal peptidase PulO-like enzyme (type II secretory pathway)